MVPEIKGQILCKVTHGSRLYKMHSEASDYDEKGIYLSDKEELYLMRAAKNYQWKEEELNKETEIFALTEFLRHAARGEGYAIDMLHCGHEDIIESSNLWDYLRANKQRFYTKGMVGLLGYAKTQSVKYGLRAERLNAVRKVLEVLKVGEQKGVAKLFQLWDDLPREQEHIVYGVDGRNNNKDQRFIEIAGKKLGPTIAVTYAIPILEHLITSYGDRTTKAAELNEVDTKSFSHALRLGYELLHIYQDKGFSYPLPENDFLLAVKYRKLDYKVNKLDEILNELITKVEQLSKVSLYPEKVDQQWLDKIVLGEYRAFAIYE